MIKHVHDRLERWSRQVADEHGGGFGRCSVFEMLRNYGCMVSSTTHADVCPVDSEAQETEKLVKALEDYHKQTIVVFYLKGIHSSIGQQAKSLKCSVSTLYRRVDAAHVLIDNELKKLRGSKGWGTYSHALKKLSTAAV